MVTLTATSLSSSSSPLNLITRRPFGTKIKNPISHNSFSYQHPTNSHLPSYQFKKAKFELSTAISSTDTVPAADQSSKDASFGQQTETSEKDEKFDWYAQWYPLMPVCDLDKRRPLGKKVMGIDIVVWWDRNENEWKVFDDTCPHRLAPLSEGRIDQWGRLQCVYHGWCFGGSGDCQFIPQAPRDGPPIHTSSKACVAAYPSCVQNGILWFWPNADNRYKDIFSKEKPPYIPEIDDPSFTSRMITRDIQYGYEVLIENLMDPSHVPYAHYGIMRAPQPSKSVKVDREGGRPLEIRVKTLDKKGFTAKSSTISDNIFIPPCVFYSSGSLGGNPDNISASPAGTTENPSTPKPVKKILLVFLCIPVSPGNSRLIFTSPRNFGVWIDRIVPRWIFHLNQNLVLDSDLYLLHVEERKIKEFGSLNWHKACFVPTKADALVVGFRRWLNKYSNGQIDWGTKYTGSLPPTPPREQLMDRYWSHTVSCSSCNLAYKGLNALEIVLQVFSLASIGIVAAAKQGALSAAARSTLVSVAIISFLVSKWLSHFVYKNFHFHDYDHASR
ncbi:protochlorophyllide-dependent translocon component 52, chloroplastic-like [Coffea eugenioides]|uniref:protochlorophyllide-dependent translocon component 52, chloroplastic-like n=1 Tax=Coffea eugenioides TaxID=49369 RepID=UPI000F609451|nr:protochlorophyllide-dependent translocon component 52, chloroplastic-like [Coffea eugenioides]